MKYTLFVICRFVSARLLCLVLFTVVGHFMFSEDIILHYDSVSICSGDSFPAQLFLENQVEVPVNCHLIGWEQIETPYIIPRQDTICYLLYTKQERQGEIYRKPVTIKIRSKPFVQVSSVPLQVCAGTLLPSVQYTAQSCDKIYWQEEKSGVEYMDLSEVGKIPNGIEEMKFLLVGSNEECPEVVYEEYSFDVIDPTRFRLSVNMPPDEVNICGDSLLLCDYVKPSIVKLFYGDDLQERFYDLPTSIEWRDEDTFTLCQHSIGESYENQYTVSTTVEESVCHTEVSMKEIHDLKLFCTGKSRPTYAISYSCTAGNGVIYMGADQPVLNVTFRSLSGSEEFVPVYKNTTEYNLETYKFPYRGCATLCWPEDEKQNMKYEVILSCTTTTGDTIFIQDTLDVSRCKKSPPMIQYECFPEDKQAVFYVSSMDSIVSLSFYTTESIDLSEIKRKNDTQKKYNYSQTYAFDWTRVDVDSLVCNIELNYIGCGNDTVRTSMNMDVKNCSPNPRIFYGAYLSPSSILLQKENCQSHQCSNQYEQNATEVHMKMNCYNDTVYIKLKGVDFEKKESYAVHIESLDSFWVVYPYEYQIEKTNSFRFYNGELMNPTLAFVPKGNCLIKGDLEGIDFLFSIEIATQVIQNEYYICQGDTLDLQALVATEGAPLKWNVSNTMVSPLKDTEYYLYGFTETGCLVDEKVMIRMSYPIWFHTDEKTFCDHSYVERSELLHTNAQKIIWYENEEMLESVDYIYLQKGNQYKVDLFSACDTQSYLLNLRIDSCLNLKNIAEETEVCDEFKIKAPAFFTPNGDGIDDYWRIDLDEKECLRWKCSIYDRFGKVIAVFENRSIQWDGLYNGVPQPSTDYWWVLKVDERNPFVGHFTLLR